MRRMSGVAVEKLGVFITPDVMPHKNISGMCSWGGAVQSDCVSKLFSSVRAACLVRAYTTSKDSGLALEEAEALEAEALAPEAAALAEAFHATSSSSEDDSESALSSVALGEDVFFSVRMVKNL